VSDTRLDVLVLGSVAIRDNAGRVPRLLERALLARLALAGGAAVPDERLAADLWGPEDLERPVQRLRVLVSRLRSALGDAGAALSRTGGGYALKARAADLDAANAAAERLRLAARTGDHRAVRSAAADALGRWRGRALDDVRNVPFAAAEGERLDALRLDLLTERLGADLELGASTLEATSELRRLVAEHPLNERLACLLAVALYRDGRQADALAAIARLRGALADELGVDPAPRTVETELRLLRQDPALAPPPAERERISVVPGPVTSFVGRDEELAALTGRLGSPCLVTLVGEPGVGKSRLALEAARRAHGRRVTMVRLAPLRGEGAVPAALASAAGHDGEPSELSEVIEALDGVVVLDNAEHLLDQVTEVAAALVRGGVSVLVTSQRPVLIAEEETFRVEPLGLAAAVRLFEERCAADARPEPGQVREICAAVDRLPLGVELAAGLTRTLTVPQLAERLHDRLGLLVGGARDEGGRHASMRAALDWSHELLPERERLVLRRVAVFRGGFELEAAEAVVAADGVAAALTELVDRSLVAVASGDGRRRFSLLESVRDHALAKLEAEGAGGEIAEVRERHLLWCLGHVRQAGEPDDFASPEAVAAVFGEWPNLREALENAVGTDRAADGLRLALELHTPWLIRGWYAEARRHMSALVNAPGATAAERATLLSDHGFVSTMAGELGEAAELLDRAAEQAAEADDDMLTMTVLYHRGIVEIERGRLRDAFTPLLAGEELALKARHEQRVSAFADALGTLHLYSGEPEIALERCRTAVAADLALGDEHGLARGLSNQAQALLDLDRHGEALVKAAESDRYARRMEDSHILGLNELIRGLAARALGDLAAAEPHLREAASSEGPGLAAVDLADVLILRGALDEAGDLLDSVYAEAVEGSTAWLAARTVSTALAAARGEDDWARELAAATVAAHAAAGFGWRRYAVRLREVVRHLDERSDERSD
jgi:predicted ATPase/DNA-binding SARP family transcriptional activator